MRSKTRTITICDNKRRCERCSKIFKKWQRKIKVKACVDGGRRYFHTHVYFCASCLRKLPKRIQNLIKKGEEIQIDYD